MYVKPISTRFSRGRSTPAMRAILALPLLVLGGPRTDDARHTPTLDHAAALADRLDTRTYLHRRSPNPRFRDSTRRYWDRAGDATRQATRGSLIRLPDSDGKPMGSPGRA